MFDLESKKPDEITINCKETSVKVNVAQGEVDAGLSVGKISGPGEFEIGEVSLKGIPVKDGRIIYEAEVGNVRIGILGDIEDGLDDLNMIDILCTSSAKAVKEISPKVVVATGNVDGMVTELKLTARTEKKLKVKKADALPATTEVVVLN